MLIQPHPFHLVQPSPWPLCASLALLTTTLSGVMSFHGVAIGPLLLSIGVITTLTTMWVWWRDCIAEGTFQGHHTKAVQRGLTMGIILFIVSEVCFFFSIFWAFFDSALAPTVELGCAWPPAGIEPINPWELPLLNTFLLLSSGATVTWSHHALIAGNRQGSILALLITLLLASIFTGVQVYEYYNATFTIADGAFGTCFFFATGFHGFHVIIGSIFLTVALFRMITYHLTNHHHVGYEGAILYWHFVDVVWIFLFIFVYYWGGGEPPIIQISPPVEYLGAFFASPCLFKPCEGRPDSSKAVPLTSAAKDAIIGLVLGDASLVKKYPNGNAYFKYAQSIKHSEYLNLVFSILSPYCKMTSPTFGQARVNGLTYGVLSFSSRSLLCFTELHVLFYLNRVKVIPSNIFDLLTPVGLAFWAMDDGSKCSNGFHLNSNAFSLDDLHLLLNVLNVKFGLICSLHARGKGHRIYISAKSMTTFRALVTPHFHSSMLYKLS